MTLTPPFSSNIPPFQYNLTNTFWAHTPVSPTSTFSTCEKPSTSVENNCCGSKPLSYQTLLSRLLNHKVKCLQPGIIVAHSATRRFLVSSIAYGAQNPFAILERSCIQMRPELTSLDKLRHDVLHLNVFGPRMHCLTSPGAIMSCNSHLRIRQSPVDLSFQNIIKWFVKHWTSLFMANGHSPLAYDCVMHLPERWALILCFTDLVCCGKIVLGC